MASLFRKNSNIKLTANFNSNEFDCKCYHKSCDYTIIRLKHVRKLQKLRSLCDREIHINSGYRCQKHNLSINGAPLSQHLIFAADLKTPIGMSFDEFLAKVHQIGFNKIIPYREKGFVHTDQRE